MIDKYDFVVYWLIYAFYLITSLLLFIGSLQELGISRLLYRRMVLQFVFRWIKLLCSIYPDISLSEKYNQSQNFSHALTTKMYFYSIN